ncbi:nascent polypeptide-associated complex subunit alpha, muscle-specific form-like [Ylistrum balloti]|uniref:nascent polypeptide-associated complex subunit alpha, muscle-specific form-like n=1 Tax=Ylistrum balloti TaxID=509963 RepID=UPI0029059B96|nr:nascent polypeptide-associated complex subunit alpha, muscle-specific form-like [Ylistrum balloti]
MDRHLLIVTVCVCLGVTVSANNPNKFRYTFTNQNTSPTAAERLQNAVVSPPDLRSEPQIRTSGYSTNGASTASSLSNKGKLVIVDTNNTAPQDITAVKTGGGDIVLTMETVPNATPSPAALTRSTDWNWIVTPTPGATPAPPVVRRTTDWNWIVTPTPRATPAPPVVRRTTDWNWIVTPTPRATPAPPVARRTTDWNWIVTPTPSAKPARPAQTRNSNWDWIVTPTPYAPVHSTAAPSAPQMPTVGPTPFYYGNTNTMSYFGMGNTVGYFGTPSYWDLQYQPQEITRNAGIKYGECPAPNVVGAKCGYRCYRDTECPQDWKCCNDGSGKPDGCCHARKPTYFESFMTSLWDTPPSQEIQNEMP